MSDSTTASAAPASLAAALDAYLEDAAHQRTENVYFNHVSLSRRFREFFEQRPVDDIARLRRPDLLAFLDWLTHKRGSFTLSTYNAGIEYLRHMGRFYLARGWVKEPWAMDIPFQTIAVEAPTVLRRAELAALIATAEKDDFRRMLVGLLGEVGLKKGEFVALRFADVELEGPVPEVVVRYTGKLEKKSRRLALPAGLAAAIRRYVARRQTSGTFNYLEPLVPLTGRQVNNIIVSLCQEAGIRRANPQILRDTAAAQALSAGRPPAEVGHQLGYTPRGYLLEFLPRFQLWIESAAKADEKGPGNHEGTKTRV